ncbi:MULTISPECIES: sensor histidine kinase [unclassified Streptomyces]|uniref:sensor histidine kinase n=1 Tax=unclassified Streptomyces TaxID=2593676 RepID=UPI0007C8392C|nr:MULTISPECIES: histidine kinase [unclassified Streptomyces]
MKPRPPRGPLANVLIGVAMTGLALLLGQDATAQGWPALDAPACALVVVVNLPAVVRTRFPVAVFLLAQSGFAVYVSLGYWPVVNSLATLLATYTLASERPARISVPGAALTGLTWLGAGVLNEAYGWHRGSLTAAAGQAVVFPAVLWWFGALSRKATELTRALAAEQEERALREVAYERGRIARELHDVVAHHMAVISVQSGLARFVFDSDPATARAALDTIADTGTEALDELRRMLTLLREGTDPRAPDRPMPGLARLGELVARVGAGGTPVALTVEGVPRPIGSGADLCAYRVVQESLTNVLKHAPGAATEVVVRYGSRHLEVDVTNEGGRTIPAHMPAGTGHGLIGMRERAKLYGGRIDIGPRDEGDGFAVRLTLPLTAQAGAPPATGRRGGPGPDDRLPPAVREG